MFNRTALDNLGDAAYRRHMLIAKDPKDLSYILGKLNGEKLSIHAFLCHSVLFRMYSKESSYKALSKYVGVVQLGKKEPDWINMEDALAELYAGNDAVWGGMFYPFTLR